MEAKRVLIHRLGSLGDTIVAVPCFHLIERSFPTAERRLLTNFPVAGKAAPAQAVLGDSGLIQGYFAYTVGLRDPRKLIRLVMTIRKWGPDAAVHIMSARGMKAARRDAAFYRACGVKRIFGVPTTQDMLENLPAGPDHYQEHEASRLARCVADLGDARLDDPGSWDLRLTKAEEAKADKVLSGVVKKPVIAFSLGTKNQTNEWGDDNWTALFASLAEEHDGTLLLIGAESESARSRAVAQGWEQKRGVGSVFDLCGQLQPRESAAVMRRANLYVGHDSGPIHLASAMQTPCVGVYSSRQMPGAWFPYGSRHEILYRPVDCMGCMLTTCIEQKKKCILSFTPADVLKRVQVALAAQAQEKSND